MDLLPIIKQNENLKDVPEADLMFLIDQGNCRTMKKGELLFHKDDPVDHMYLVLTGNLKLYLHQNGQRQELNSYGPGEILGLLPYSRMKKSGGDCEVTEDSQVMTLHKDKFRKLIENHYELTAALVHFMTTRVRSFTSLQLRNEKLISLGKLSSGLAHELNNPASAIVRSSEALKGHLKLIPENFKKVIQIKVTEEQVNVVNELLFSKINNPNPTRLTLLERTDAEDELADWLSDKGMDDPESLAETLVDNNFNQEELRLIFENTGKKDFAPVIRWVESNLITEKMVNEIEEAAQRIATLISSVKSYSYMDQSREKQEADLHAGIESTLNILNHKTLKNKVSIEKDFDNNLPKVSVFPGQINQVWTNIIDNALDAMETGGKLIIKTKYEEPYVHTYIIDSGGGIPEEALNNIFDPFFTTKEIGKGTGLGLDIVNKIITQHKGSIKINSKPGRTEFDICLPVS